MHCHYYLTTSVVRITHLHAYAWCVQLDDWVLCRVRKKGVSLGPADMDDTSEGITTTTTRAAVPANDTDYHHAQLEMATATQREVLRHHQVPDAGTGGGFGDVVIDWNKNDDDGGDASGGLSGSPSAHHMHHDQGHGHGGMVPVPGAASAAPPHTQHHHGLVSVLESIKRNMLFQAMKTNIACRRPRLLHI